MQGRRLEALVHHLSPASTASGPEPFTLAISDVELNDLKTRLARTRFPDQLEDLASGWEYGTELGFMKEVVKYWKDDFDWRANEKRFNDLGVQKRTVSALNPPKTVLFCSRSTRLRSRA